MLFSFIGILTKARASYYIGYTGIHYIAQSKRIKLVATIKTLKTASYDLMSYLFLFNLLILLVAGY